MSTPVNAELREKAKRILDRATNDEDYLKALQENPSAVLQEGGFGPDATISFNMKDSSVDGEVEGFCAFTSICVNMTIISYCRDTGLREY